MAQPDHLPSSSIVTENEEDSDFVTESEGAEDDEGELTHGNAEGNLLGYVTPEPKKRPTNLVLPETVTVIDNDATGGRVYIVGTAHFGTNSQEDVALTIQTTKPDFVVLELCPERKAILTLNDSELRAEPTFADLQQMMKTMNASQAVLQFALLKVSAHCTKKLGMMPGGEMRRAYQEAVGQRNTMIFLGDRPISVTLKRAFGSLNFFQRLRFFWVLLREMRTDISMEDVEKCKSSDVVEELIEKLSKEFPELHRVLVAERDLFLTHMLKTYTMKEVRTTSGPRPSVVVGVVGIGHVPGIKRAWENGILGREQMIELMTIPQPTLASKVVSASVKVAFLGLIGYGAFRLGSRVYRRFL